MAERACPFYGRALVAIRPDPPFLLVSSGGNQCAIVTTAHSPCIMEPVDWRACPRIAEICPDNGTTDGG